MKLRAPIHRIVHYPHDSLSLTLAAALLLAAAIIGCQRSSNRSERVELILPASLTPASTVELRFEDTMVNASEVGKPATHSPLVFEPPVAGVFTWLSTRSGVLTPSEPLTLDTRYSLALRPGLIEADGRPSRARLRWTLATPPFALKAFCPRETDSNEPEIKLIFNAEVRAGEAQPFLCFRDAAGHSVGAEARQGTVEEMPAPYELGWVDPSATWSQEFSVPRRSRNDHEANPTNALPDLLVVTPRHPLPLGKGWRLVVRPRLPSVERHLFLRSSAQVAIGDVTPFVVQQVTPQNYVSSGASIRMTFSKPLAPELTNVLNWLTITPQPSNLTAYVWGRDLTLTGEFHSQKSYTLALDRRLQSSEASTLTGSNAFQVRMPPIAPRLYFPACARDQLAGGTRQFPLMAVNVPWVQVRAKLLEPHTAIHALRAYETYFRSWDERRDSRDSDESYQPVPYDLVPGHTIFREQFKIGAEPDTAKTVALSWDQLLAGRRAGVVFLEVQSMTHDSAHHSSPGAQALIQVTDLGLVCKKFSSGVDVFVFSHNSGQAVPGATAVLYSDENQPLSQAVTDASGVAHLTAQTNAEWVAAQIEDDFHAVALDHDKMWRYGFDLPMSGSSEPEDPRRVLLFSERNLYRPGEELHLQALARDWAANGLVVPADLTGTLQCFDARGRAFFQTNVPFSASGAWSGSIALPTGTRGGYCARLLLGQRPTIYTFQVADFQPNGFEITLPTVSEFRAGERVEVPVNAHYFFGKSLSRAQVKWSLDASDVGFRPRGFGRYKFTGADSEWRLGRGASAQSLNGQGILLRSNSFVIGPELAVNPACPQPRHVSLLVEITDLNQQTVSRRLEFVRHSADFYLGLAQGADVLSEGNSLPLEVLAVGADGKPWPEKVSARMTLQRISWATLRVQGAGKSVRYRNEAVITNLLEEDILVVPLSHQMAEGLGLRADTDDEIRGQRLPDLPGLPAGDYLLEVRAKDAGGRPVVSSLNFQVSAPTSTSWSYRDETRITLKPDQKVYAPGQTAEILVETPISGTAYVTVEREKVLRSFVCRLEGNAPALRVPLEAGDVPNVFVSATLVRGADDCPHKNKEPEYRKGTCELAVSDPQSRLTVTVTPAATNYLPAQNVDVTVQVTDPAGKTVPGADVVLYAVDDGILGLSDYELPDPHGFFYAPRPLCVQSSVSLPNLLAEDPEQLRFENKGFLAGGGGLESVRKNFLACAFWKADLCSDADGQASARFAAPDSLTRYRLFAVAFTGSRFGSGKSAFKVAKPLMIEPALPRFALVTDRLAVRGVVQNQTDRAGDALVSLELDDKVAASRTDRVLTRRVSVPAQGSAVVEFPLQFTETGFAKWIWKARFAEPLAAFTTDGSPPPSAGFTDAVQSELEVGHIAPVLREVLLTRVNTPRTNLLEHANPQLLGGSGQMTICVANTRLNELAEAIAQLLHYPYGCAEQTGSSLLPWIVLHDVPGLQPLLRRTVKEITAGQRVSESPARTRASPAPGGEGWDEGEQSTLMNRAIHAGVTRLFSMQTSSGGLGYWPGASEPMLWASAYGGLVLAQASRHGVKVPQDEFEALLRFLSAQLRSASSEGEDAWDACLALYALAVAGRAEPAYHEKYFAVREKLSSENRALLALAVAETHGPASMIGKLLQPDSPWRRRKDARFGCDARERAIRLLAWTLYRPQDPTVDRLVEDLMSEQKQAHWGTTQGDAWALLALTEYGRRVEGTLEPAQGELRWADRTIPFRLDNTTRLFTQTVPLAQKADASLLLLNPSNSRLYTTIQIEARPPETPQPRQDRGLSLQRRYERLDDENQPQDLQGLRVGDRVLVTLLLSLREPAHYVVIDDSLPSVLEVVNPELRTQQARASGLGGDGQWWTSDFREIRKDRSLYFADWVPAGSYKLHYVARVRAAGTATAPSAKAEEMYHPERCGLSGSRTISSAALD